MNDAATPEIPLKTSIWTPVFESPQASVERQRSMHPKRYVCRFPTISEIEPHRSRVQPQVRE
jgi:hypothetical protein